MSRVPAWTMAAFALLSIVFPAFAGTNDRIRIESGQIESVTQADIKSLPSVPGGRGLIHSLTSSADHEDIYALGQWSFDSCQPEGWTSADLTAQTDNYWQVEDFAGFPASPIYVPINGSQSMWLGNADANACFSTYPGYGDNWDQCLESRAFTMSNDARISFFAAWHMRDDHTTKLEYQIDGGAWTQAAVYFTGPQSATAETRIIASPTGGMGTYEIRFRFRFRSFRTGSDESGFDTDGAFVIDDITVEEASVGVHDFEDWEGEMLGMPNSDDNDWVGMATPAFGDYATLFSASETRQEDICVSKDCGWGFWLGTPELWDCVGPDPAMRYATSKPVYQFNEIQSPVIDITTGVPADATVTRLRYCVYRDLPINDIIYYMVHVRWSPDGVCWSQWQNDGFLYFGTEPAWDVQDIDISELFDPSAAFIQVGLAVIDAFDPYAQILPWSGCHRQGPIFDDIEVYRVDPNGPVFDVSAKHLFQDNFPSDGTITGTVRADMAADVASFANPGIVPGDSVVANVIDPNDPIDTDGQFGGPAIYLHVRDSGGKSGVDLEGGARWPWVSGESSGGWSAYRFDQAYFDAALTLPIADRYCVDLKDDIFEAGNIVEFYFSARSTAGATTYYSEFTGTTNSEAAVRAQPMEFTCLPALGQTGTEVLFVNDAVGSDARDAMQAAAATLGVPIDRYDVRAADENVGNSLASRLINANLLTTYYLKIIWSSGCDTLGTIGAGDATEKSDDFSLLFDWMSNHPEEPGLYLNGANIACEWDGIATASALSLRNTFMDFRLDDCCHRDAGAANAPAVAGVLPLTFFQTSGVADVFTVDDGCPDLCCYDLIAPNSTAASFEMRYGGSDGAVLSQSSFNNAGSFARIVLSGFPFEEIQDNGVGVDERALHLYRILDWMNCPVNPPPTAIGGGRPAPLRDELSQNYPNPFNPSTTIRFSVKERGYVTLRVYDVSGALVRTLVEREVAPRAEGYEATWDGLSEAGRPAASGVYFYRLTAGGFSETRKLVLMK